MARTYHKGDEPVPGYRLIQFLGRGGFGEAWKASAPGGAECAIKIINLADKQGLKEFRAVRLVKKIHHPHLTPIIAFWLKDEQGTVLDDIGEADSVRIKGTEAELIVAMGLGDKNLADRLKECKNTGESGIPADELLSYMEDAAKAIDFLNQPRHELGSGPVAIQHCDIKPQNILIVGGSAQVCDFGLARQLNDARRTSMAAGTYAYIAPESIENKPSKTNDQYSLAISYVELRTGSLPFSASSLYEVMFAHLENRLDFSKLSEPEGPVLRKATSKNPEERYLSTLDFVRALRRAIEGGMPSQSQVSITTKGRELRPGVEIVPGHKLVSFIGRGGYGEVWKATAPGGMPLALKIIRNLEGGGGRQEFKALELIKGVEHNHLMELRAYWLLDKEGMVIPDDVRERPDAGLDTGYRGQVGQQEPAGTTA
jgi:serine/threonine protein kinase